MVVNFGDDPAFTITPNTGYHVQDVLVDGSSVGAVTTYTFSNVAANHTIAASFAINTYTIAASAGREWVDLADRIGRREPRRQPDVHDHPVDELPRGGCAGGRSSVGAVTTLHVHERDGRPHDRGQLRDQHVHDHGLGGSQWLDLAGVGRWW